MSIYKRIEAEDLKPGDTFEYEHHDWYSVPSRWKSEVKRDTVRKDPVIREAVLEHPEDCPDREYFTWGNTGWMSPEKAAALPHQDQIVILPASEVTPEWYRKGHEEEVLVSVGVRHEKAVFLLTHEGQNNHGYVWLRPKTVVVLITEETEA